MGIVQATVFLYDPPAFPRLQVATCYFDLKGETTLYSI